MTRRTLLAMLHIGKKNLGFEDATYRAWLEKHTGKRSGADCTNKELAALTELLHDAGALDEPAAPARVMAGTSADRPTARQWQTARGRVKKLGLDGGIDGAAFAVFVQRIAKVDSPRFLTRTGMQSVLIGLEKWAAQRETKSRQNKEQEA